MYDNLINTGLYKNLIFEILINIIAPYPFLDNLKYREYVAEFDFNVQYEINDILLFISFARVYLGITFIVYLT